MAGSPERCCLWGSHLPSVSPLASSIRSSVSIAPDVMCCDFKTTSCFYERCALPCWSWARCGAGGGAGEPGRGWRRVDLLVRQD